MHSQYKGLIWTDHALQKLKERSLRQKDAWLAWHKPDNSRFAETKNAWIYYKKIADQIVEVVAKKNQKGKWVIISVWSKKIKLSRSKQRQSRFINLISKIKAKLLK